MLLTLGRKTWSTRELATAGEPHSSDANPGQAPAHTHAHRGRALSWQQRGTAADARRCSAPLPAEMPKGLPASSESCLQWASFQESCRGRKAALCPQTCLQKLRGLAHNAGWTAPLQRGHRTPLQALVVGAECTTVQKCFDLSVRGSGGPERS